MPQGIGYRGFRGRRGGALVPQPIGEPVIAPLPGGFRQRGRGGDTEVAHVTPGETLVPVEVASQPGVRQGLTRGFRRAGMNPERFVVRSGRNSINPSTGAREFFAGDDFDSEQDRSFDQGDAQQRENEAQRDGFNGNPRDIGQDSDRNGFGSGVGSGGGGSLGRFRNSTPPVSPTDGLPEDFFTQDAALGRFRTSPGFEFRFDRGIDALDRSAARFGSLFSGNQATAITELGQNLATAEFQNYWNRLASLTGIGQASAAQTGAGGVQVAGQQGAAILAGGDAAASGAIGVNNAIQGGISNALYSQYLNQRSK